MNQQINKRLVEEVKVTHWDKNIMVPMNSCQGRRKKEVCNGFKNKRFWWTQSVGHLKTLKKKKKVWERLEIIQTKRYTEGPVTNNYD